MKIIKINECPSFLSGIYKLNFPNQKYYIGLSNNIKRRMKEHKTDSKKNILPIHNAIQKYGMPLEFELLEEIPSENRKLLQEREIYWIHFYDSTNPLKGYNISLGGDGSNSGIYNLSSALNEKQLNEIYELLINHTNIFIYQIAEKYNVSSELISNINTGKHYYNSKLTYPLRPPTTFKKGHNIAKKGIENHNSKFTEETLLEVIDMIKNSELSLQAIGE